MHEGAFQDTQALRILMYTKSRFRQESKGRLKLSPHGLPSSEKCRAVWVIPGTAFDKSKMESTEGQHAGNSRVLHALLAGISQEGRSRLLYKAQVNAGQ